MNSICIFSAQFLPHMGGIERYTYNLACKLVEKGVAVTVVTSNVGQLKCKEDMDGFVVYRLPCFDLLDGRYPVIKCNQAFKDIDKSLKEKKFDLIFVNARFYIHSLYAVQLAKKMKVRSIVVEHGTSHLQIHHPILDTLGSYYEHALTSVLKHYCKEYYGVSKACVEWLMHFHIEAKGVFYNAIDLPVIREIAVRKKINYRKQYNIPSDAIVITFTGRLLEGKGVPSLVRAVKKLQLANKNIFLFLAGDGELENWVAENQNDYIIPLGRLAQEEVICLLEDSDIFCLPSFSEGFSTSILEAVACGCYIVTTKRGGSKELLINDSYGTILPDNSPETVYNGLVRIVKEAEQREIGVKLSYERLKYNFTWDITADKVFKL